MIVRVLGQGGFGITYLARDTEKGTQVAIKEFFPHDYCGRYPDGRVSTGNSNSAQIVEILRRRFYKEANNLSHLNHPNIVKIHEVFDENDTTYIVMDFIQGETLQAKVRRLGVLSEAKASQYIRAVGAALAYIHDRHMTHFDVKPANVIVRGVDDRPILIDFGFSKEYSGEGNGHTMTPPAISPGYSPMELYSRETFVPYSPQSDIYSMGATLFYLIIGQAPPTPGELMEHGYRLPETVSAEMRQAIGKAMKIPRNQRTDKVADILNLLPQPEPAPTPNPVPNPGEHTILINDNNDRFILRRITELEKENKELHQRCEYAEAMVNEYENSSEEEPSAFKKNIPWILLFIIGVICIVAMSQCSQYESNYHNVYFQRQQLENQINSLQQRNRTLENTMKTISAEQPLFIEAIEVKGGGASWNEKIYSSKTTYVDFRIKTITLSNEGQTVGVKIYSPYGLTTGVDSKNGFSYTEFVSSFDGWNNISGWGSPTKGWWKPGNYRIEIWLGGKCLAKKSFHVY